MAAFGKQEKKPNLAYGKMSKLKMLMKVWQMVFLKAGVTSEDGVGKQKETKSIWKRAN